MRTLQPYLIPMTLCLAMVGMTAVARTGRGPGARGMNAGQLARFAVDIHEVNSPVSLYAWYHAARRK